MAASLWMPMKRTTRGRLVSISRFRHADGVPDGGAVGPGYGVAIAIGEVYIIRTDGIVVFETVNLAALVFEQVLYCIVFVVFSHFFGDGMLNGACGDQHQQKDGEKAHNLSFKKS